MWHKRETRKKVSVGDVMPDGTRFAGMSPDDGKPMFTTPADAALSYTFNESRGYAAQQNLQFELGHRDWRPPSKNELKVLFKNRAEIGGFNQSPTNASIYWSSKPDYEYDGWGVCFNDGSELLSKGVHHALRLVRS